MPLQRLHQAADILRSKGLTVEEIPDWKTTSRSDDRSVYSEGRPTHFMHHHTASPITAHNSHDRCIRESRALQILEPNEPISNFAVCPHGCWFTVCAGPSNTNGVGVDVWHPSGHPLRVPENSMNSYAMAVEILNNGVGEPYTDGCQNALVIGTAALCIAYNVGAYENRGHFEWAPTRKVDPAGPSQWMNPADKNKRWNMNAFRATIQDEINRQRNPAPSPTPSLGDNMVSCINDNGGYYLYDQFVRRPVEHPGNDMALVALLWDLEDQGVKFSGHDGTKPRGIPIPFVLHAWQEKQFRSSATVSNG